MTKCIKHGIKRNGGHGNDDEDDAAVWGLQRWPNGVARRVVQTADRDDLAPELRVHERTDRDQSTNCDISTCVPRASTTCSANLMLA